MMQETKSVGFEEIHITKREDGKGFNLKAKGFWNGEPCIIDAPFLQQPNLDINTERKHEYLYGKFMNHPFGQRVSLEFSADIKLEKDTYYTITIDPVFYTKKQIKKLENEIEEIKNENDEKLKCLLDRINELKKSV